MGGVYGAEAAEGTLDVSYALADAEEALNEIPQLRSTSVITNLAPGLSEVGPREVHLLQVGLGAAGRADSGEQQASRCEPT